MANLENIFEPDPSWDYYEIWHTLHGIKARIETSLNLMSKVEKADSQTDEKLTEILEPAFKELEQILDEYLIDYFSEEEEA